MRVEAAPYFRQDVKLLNKILTAEPARVSYRMLNPTDDELQKIARTLSITIISGVSEKEGELIYNSQAVIDSTGAIVAKYRKIHLFAPAPVEEDKYCAPGHELVSVALGPIVTLHGVTVPVQAVGLAVRSV